MHHLLEYALTLTEGHFNGDAQKLHAFLGAARMTKSLASKKLDYLRRIPWLLASLGEREGIAAECLSQFVSAPASRHHPVSLFFLGPESELRPMIEQMAETGCDVPNGLAQWQGLEQRA